MLRTNVIRLTVYPDGTHSVLRETRRNVSTLKQSVATNPPNFHQYRDRDGVDSSVSRRMGLDSDDNDGPRLRRPRNGDAGPRVVSSKMLMTMYNSPDSDTGNLQRHTLAQSVRARILLEGIIDWLLLHGRKRSAGLYLHSWRIGFLAR